METMVKRLFEQLESKGDATTREERDGKISFENAATFRGDESDAINEKVAGLTVSGDAAPGRRNTRADQFCVLRNSANGTARPVVAIEYKAPHKLTIRSIVTGLQGVIWPERDVIDQNHDNFEFLSKNLMTAVITQLFSYMIDKGVRYGYVCTGEAFVFLRIDAEDPTRVYYSVNIPRQDYEVDPENRLQRTAVSQVFAFVTQALQEEAPNQIWMDRAKRELTRWKVEFIDVLRKIPETERLSRDASAYQPSEWVPSIRGSPARLRHRCSPLTTQLNSENGDSSGSESDGPHPSHASPTPQIQTRSRAAVARPQNPRDDSGTRRDAASTKGHRGRARTATRIEERPYCTHQCLLGLTQGLQIDAKCPNADEHGSQHLVRTTFLALLRSQLAIDRGTWADCCPLYIQGSRGAILKVRLSSHGYTFLAKGAESCNVRHLQNEEAVYQQLRPLQGSMVPVCVGATSLELPYHYNGAELAYLLVLSWAGRSVGALMRDPTRHQAILKSCERRTVETLQRIHEYRVQHCDVELRNILFDARTATLMLVDFERSIVHTRPALAELSPNRKRKRRVLSKECRAEDIFIEEVANARFNIGKHIHTDI